MRTPGKPNARDERGERKIPPHLGKITKCFWFLKLMLCEVQGESETKEHHRFTPEVLGALLIPRLPDPSWVASSPRASAASSKSGHLQPDPWALSLPAPQACCRKAQPPPTHTPKTSSSQTLSWSVFTLHNSEHGDFSGFYFLGFSLPEEVSGGLCGFWLLYIWRAGSPKSPVTHPTHPPWSKGLYRTNSPWGPI